MYTHILAQYKQPHCTFEQLLRNKDTKMQVPKKACSGHAQTLQTNYSNVSACA